VEVDGRPFLQIRPRGGNGRRAGVGEWEAAANLERGGRAGRAGVGGWQAAPGRERTGARCREGGREGHGEEKPTRFRKRGVRLAFSDTLRATGDRGSAFATGHRTRAVCAGLLAYSYAAPNRAVVASKHTPPRRADPERHRCPPCAYVALDWTTAVRLVCKRRGAANTVQDSWRTRPYSVHNSQPSPIRD